MRQWIKQLTLLDRQAIGEDLQLIQFGWDEGVIGEPLVKSLGGGLFEVRSALPTHRIARIFFCIFQNKIILPYGFIKKTQKTPLEALALAKKRQHELMRQIL